jgi:hypothetical protein
MRNRAAFLPGRAETCDRQFRVSIREAILQLVNFLSRPGFRTMFGRLSDSRVTAAAGAPSAVERRLPHDMKSLPDYTVATVLWLLAAATAPAADEPWPQDEREAVRMVNEGELVFLQEPPRSAVHHHRNKIQVTNRSLNDGWAALVQCHENIDPVPAAEIVFNSGRIRNLSVRDYRNIERVQVEGDTVQLVNVGGGARLCLTADTRAVRKADDYHFSVRNGPFMRKFLDGYYPMHLSMAISVPPGAWQLDDSDPVAQPGFRLWQEGNVLNVEAWFEGELRTEFRFRRVPGRVDP